MKRLLKIYMEKPELAAGLLLVILAIVFQSRSNGFFFSTENLRGILGLIPETGLVAIGVTLLTVSYTHLDVYKRQVVLAASTHVSLNAPNALVQESVRAYYRTWYRDLVTAVPEVTDG